MLKILITGASSYIGTYLCREFSRLIAEGNAFSVTGLYNTHPVEYENIKTTYLDITLYDELKNMFIETKPDIVIHLASVTQTKISGYNEQYIHLVNHTATQNIAELCSEINSKLIYTSTDLVYKEGINLKEDTAPLEPLTVYAKTKLLGEEAVKQFAREFIILRLSLVIGKTISTYKTFFDEVYYNLSRGKTYHAFTDQYRCPIYINDVISCIIKLTGQKLSNQTVNLCGDEYLSRYEIGLMIADAFGFDKELIQKASSDEFQDYKMVKHLLLNNQRMKFFGLNTKPLKEFLQHIEK